MFFFSSSGPLLTCKKGTLKDGKRTDVDKDFTVLFTVLDENESWLLNENIEKFAPDAAKKTDDEDFQESNKMHVINGYFYGNLPDMKLCLGDQVSWHLFGIGNEVDIHTGETATSLTIFLTHFPGFTLGVKVLINTLNLVRRAFWRAGKKGPGNEVGQPYKCVSIMFLFAFVNLALPSMVFYSI